MEFSFLFGRFRLGARPDPVKSGDAYHDEYQVAHDQRGDQVAEEEGKGKNAPKSSGSPTGGVFFIQCDAQSDETDNHTQQQVEMFQGEQRHVRTPPWKRRPSCGQCVGPTGVPSTKIRRRRRQRWEFPTGPYPRHRRSFLWSQKSLSSEQQGIEPESESDSDNRNSNQLQHVFLSFLDGIEI
jgi:hypothetical protein